MTGGPSPSRSKAMGVPSLEVTFSIALFLPRSSGPFLVDHRSSKMPPNGLRSGRPVGEVEDTRLERLRLHELERLLLSKALEEPLAAAHHHGVDHELELVEEPVLQQRTN